MRITTSALIGIAAVGLLAGCGPSSSSTAAVGGSASAASASAASTSGSANSGSGSSGGTAAGCPEASTVSSGLGISGLTAQTSKATTSQDHTGYACTYAAGTNIVTVTLVNGVSGSFMSAAAQKTASFLSGAKSASGLKTVPGFADQAYSFSTSVAGVTQNELIARKGSVEAVVVSGATLSQEEALAQSIFTQDGA